MSDFFLYFKQGVFHILDLNGLDHLYFIISFSLLYSFEKWKQVVGLVTAFTIGHCLTLLLSGLNIISINPNLVETLIPITILLSCANNFWVLLSNKRNNHLVVTYPILLCFGLIHGLGFSNFLRMMLFEDDSILSPLLGFNLGIELAQLIIVFLFLSLIYLVKFTKLNLTYTRVFINLVISIMVLLIMF
ncbi:HupE/UreJ family protein [Pseudotamlana agarivorans]|uniref:HupE/UreJ family protein n=1 Tax=Pseudotamlana agarivorans TaxID=481183 RepID=UPI0008326455